MLAIFLTLAGLNNEVRPEIAFNMILDKFLIYDAFNNWIYVLKLLILLDRIVESKFFLFDIAELQMTHIEKYKDEDSRNSY